LLLETIYRDGKIEVGYAYLIPIRSFMISLFFSSLKMDAKILTASFFPHSAYFHEILQAPPIHRTNEKES